MKCGQAHAKTIRRFPFWKNDKKWESDAGRRYFGSVVHLTIRRPGPKKGPTSYFTFVNCNPRPTPRVNTKAYYIPVPTNPVLLLYSDWPPIWHVKMSKRLPLSEIFSFITFLGCVFIAHMFHKNKFRKTNQLVMV